MQLGEIVRVTDKYNLPHSGEYVGRLGVVANSATGAYPYNRVTFSKYPWTGWFADFELEVVG